jgi:hypothetical protein
VKTEILSRKRFFAFFSKGYNDFVSSYEKNSLILFANLMSSIKKDIAYDANSKAIGKYFDFINTSLGTIFSQLKIEVTNKINKFHWLSKIELENYKIDELFSFYS